MKLFSKFIKIKVWNSFQSTKNGILFNIETADKNFPSQNKEKTIKMTFFQTRRKNIKTYFFHRRRKNTKK